MVAPSKARCGREAGGVCGVRVQVKASAADFSTVAMTRSPELGRYCGLSVRICSGMVRRGR